MASNRVAKRTGNELELTAKDVKDRIVLIQHVMKAVMKEGVHYGIVPGTPKKSLWKPGAEVLCVTFRIAPSFIIDNQSDDDHYEYIVTSNGTHQVSQSLLGAGVGACSSNEEKYKWKAAFNEEHFESIEPDRRREVWKSTSDGYKLVLQIRAEPADINNTILKMAAKRAHVAMAINVTGASDIFMQDLGDDEGGGGGAGGNRGGAGGSAGRQNSNPPRSTGAGGGTITGPQKGLLVRKLGDAGIDGRLLCEHFAIQDLEQLPKAKMDEALTWISGPKAGNAPQG